MKERLFWLHQPAYAGRYTTARLTTPNNEEAIKTTHVISVLLYNSEFQLSFLTLMFIVYQRGNDKISSAISQFLMYMYLTFLAIHTYRPTSYAFLT